MFLLCYPIFVDSADICSSGTVRAAGKKLKCFPSGFAKRDSIHQVCQALNLFVVPSGDAPRTNCPTSQHAAQNEMASSKGFRPFQKLPRSQRAASYQVVLPAGQRKAEQKPRESRDLRQQVNAIQIFLDGEMIYNVIPSKIQPRHIKDDGTLAKNTLSIWDWGSHMLDRLHEMFLVSTWRTDGVSHVVQRLEEVVEKRVPKNARASQGVYNIDQPPFMTADDVWEVTKHFQKAWHKPHQTPSSVANRVPTTPKHSTTVQLPYRANMNRVREGRVQKPTASNQERRGRESSASLVRKQQRKKSGKDRFKDTIPLRTG